MAGMVVGAGWQVNGGGEVVVDGAEADGAGADGPGLCLRPGKQVPRLRSGWQSLF